MQLFSSVVILFFLAFTANLSQAQISQDQDKSYKPIVLNLDEDGNKYVRFIMWHQIWMTTNNLSDEVSNLQLHPSIRRSRFLAYAQISEDFLILTHFGLNNLTTENMSSLGNNGDAPQLFLHGAWGEFRVNDQLFIGGGLHYWKGLSRLASQSTLNFMTLDQTSPITSWHSLGITDQFARHLGVYAKGQIGKFDYRVAMNSPIRHPLGDGKDYGLYDSGMTYTGARHLDKEGNEVGNTITEGYVRYNFWDNESTKLPYNVGTYLGKKRILAIGAGFFIHPNGMYNEASGEHYNVRHFAVDGFLDLPLPEGSFHAYASITNFDYGHQYVSRWAGTGNTLYGQAGYYLRAVKMMPYVAISNSKFGGFQEPVTTVDVGVNYFIRGHNAKLTLEYHRINGDVREATILTQNDALSQVRLQMHIFL